MANTDAVAWWGAALSTLLGVTTLYDRFLRKPVPLTSYSFSSSADRGSEVILANPSPAPVMIAYWRLYRAKPKGWFGLQRTRDEAAPDAGELGFTAVQPHSWYSLHFRGENNIAWGGKVEELGSLYIELDIVGRRRPVTLHVFNVNNKEPWSSRRLLPHFLRPLTTGSETIDH